MRTRPPFHVSLVLLTLAGFCSTAHAQVVLRTHDTFYSGLAIARGMDGVGDVNADGVGDYAIGYPRDYTFGLGTGVVRVFSGLDGSVLRVHPGVGQEQLGTVVKGLGDVDGDGIDDLGASALEFDNGFFNAGRVRVFSGATGLELLSVEGTASNQAFGAAMCRLGDVNGDGHQDFVVSAYDANFNMDGAVHVVSGLDGSLLASQLGAPGARLGSSLSFAGDQNADGTPDFAVITQFGSRVQTRSGLDGTVIRGISSGLDFFGTVDADSDIDGDGTNDLVVSALIITIQGSYSGSANVYSGATGQQLFHYDAAQLQSTSFGVACEALPDLDGDGRGEFAVASYGYSWNAAPTQNAQLFLFSGTGALLYRVDGALSAAAGGGLVQTGDIDGDGRPELLFDAEFDYGTNQIRGLVRVITSLSVIGATTTCPVTPNSTGVPARLQVFGTSVLGSDHLHVRASNLPAFALGYLVASQTTQGGVTPPNSQGTLCLGGTIGRFFAQAGNSGTAGLLFTDIDLANMPSPLSAVQAGETWTFQAWHRDANPTTTSNFSEAVTVVFQ
ncbi:MAG: FG-GAP-like repeat-containing protein [Planctomycetota bacterium]